jgi:S-layer homology domain
MKGKWVLCFFGLPAKKLINGNSDRLFDSSSDLTGEQNAKQKTTVTVDSEQNYSDIKSVSDYALEYVRKAHTLGGIEGEGGKFQPRESSTRAQAAKVISVLLKQIESR